MCGFFHTLMCFLFVCCTVVRLVTLRIYLHRVRSEFLIYQHVTVNECNNCSRIYPCPLSCYTYVILFIFISPTVCTHENRCTERFSSWVASGMCCRHTAYTVCGNHMRTPPPKRLPRVVVQHEEFSRKKGVQSTSYLAVWGG